MDKPPSNKETARKYARASIPNQPIVNKNIKLHQNAFGIAILMNLSS